MKIGIEDVAYLSTDESEFKKLAQHGYEAIDYGGLAKPSCPLYRLTDEELADYLRSLRAKYEAVGVTVGQMHALWPTDDTSEEKRSKMREYYVREIKAAAVLGCPYLVIHPCMPDGWHNEVDAERSFLLNVELFRYLLPYAKQYGVVLCVENMPFKKQAISSPLGIKRLVREIDDPYLKVCLDTGHANVFSNDIGADIRLFGDDLAVLHVHDNNGREDRHQPPYMGTIDWDAFTDALAEIGFSGIMSLETVIPTKMPEPMREQMRVSLAALARHLSDQVEARRAGR